MKPAAKFVGLVVTFTAVISVCSTFAHTIAWFGHPTIGAILATFLYLTAFGVTGRLGAMPLIGLPVVVKNSFVFASLLSLPVPLVRGATFDSFFLVTRRWFYYKKCAIASPILSFYLTMITIYALHTFQSAFHSFDNLVFSGGCAERSFYSSGRLALSHGFNKLQGRG